MKDDLKLNVSTNFDLLNNNEKDVTLILEDATKKETGSVTGTVFDTSLTGEVVVGATVKVFLEDGTPYMHTLTDNLGNYSINDLPIGIYKIAAVKNGYLLSNMISLTISDIVPIKVDLILQKEIITNNNIVYGKILNFDSKEPLSDVNVLLYKNENGEKVLVSSSISISDGEYLLDKIEDGTYELAFEKKGYKTTVINTIVLNNNIKFKVDILLENVVGNINSTVSGIIKDSLGQIVPNAFVGLYTLVGDVETLVATTYTNVEGKYMFGNVTEGKYIVKAKLSNTGI